MPLKILALMLFAYSTASLATVSKYLGRGSKIQDRASVDCYVSVEESHGSYRVRTSFDESQVYVFEKKNLIHPYTNDDFQEYSEVNWKKNDYIIYASDTYNSAELILEKQFDAYRPVRVSVWHKMASKDYFCSVTKKLR